MGQSQSIGKLVEALISAQKDFDPIIKDKKNPFFKSKYADLESCVAATQPGLQKHGLAILQLPVSSAGGVGVHTFLSHTSGEFISELYTLPLVKQDAQTGVAAVTYARRAAYLGVLGIAAEDDDGNVASGHRDEELEERPAPKAKSTKSNSPAAFKAEESIAEEKSAQISAGSSAPLTDEDTEAMRNKFRLLGDDLAAAGLKAAPKLPIARKLLAYLCKTTGAPSADAITRTQWATFWEVVSGVKKSEGGIKELVKLVDAASNPKKSEEE